MVIIRLLVRQNNRFNKEYANKSLRHIPRKPNYIIKVEYGNGFNKKTNG